MNRPQLPIKIWICWRCNLCIIENVRTILEEYAKDQGFHRVEEMILAIGALSCVEIEALNFTFETLMKGFLAEVKRLRGRHVVKVGAINCYGNVA